MAEDSGENSLTLGSFFGNTELQVSCAHESLVKLPHSQELVAKTETVSREAAFVETESIHRTSTDVPFVDTEALKILENKATEVDRNLQRMMGNITRNLNGISTTSVQYAECYRDCVKNVGNASDNATKAMGKLIGKCEEMNKNMEPLYNMAEQVKMIIVLLDQFEEKCK
ncbi:BLOC-1-related complex subunit 6-like [Dendronephthya gigantea]|uniref:BLOC-1-related complex subunit 6-like n=1 Tax=Dendronephthya gigantea TaxID=151771 RepID=UPI00106AEF8E|nr:BLOC-1-related complex subunit 6-like [Dendronephthya gigantea]